MLYVLVEPWHTDEGPEMVPGWSGIIVTVTLLLRGGLEPQALSAVTVIFPPLVPAVALIEVVDELPVQPEGKVQV